MQATRKVIIADESREFAVPCASLLKSFGVEAILVPKDGEALYEAIVAQKPQAVLCDVFMPHSDAIGVMKRVREEDDLPQPQLWFFPDSTTSCCKTRSCSPGHGTIF